VRAVGTAERLRALTELHVIDPALARDVIDALHCLMRLRLGQQLSQRTAGEVADNKIRPADLGSLDRDALQDALAIVKRLRTLLVLNFRLDEL
jgi:CBS domain-containing protein